MSSPNAFEDRNPKIRQLNLQKWKSFEQATLYIDPITILIGTNASGKSNVLDALLFLQRVSAGVGIFQAINGDANIPSIRGGIEWVCRKPAKTFQLEVTVDGETTDQALRYRLQVQLLGLRAEVLEEELTLLKYGARAQTPRETRLFYTQTPAKSAPAIPVYFFTGTRGPGKRVDLNRSHVVIAQAETVNVRKEVLDGIRVVLSPLQKIFVFDPIPSHMRDYTPFSERLETDGRNIAGVLAALGPQQKRAVEGAITKYLKELPERDIKRIWTEAIGKFQTDAMLYCEEGWGTNASHVVDARGMSDGSLRYLGIVAAMLIRASGSLLVIEEVDNGLHPSRAHVLMEMLRTIGRERQIDVIVTTHNPALLDAAGSEMVPFITVVHRHGKTGESLLTQLEDVESLPKMMASGTLGRLSAQGRIEQAVRKAEVQ